MKFLILIVLCIVTSGVSKNIYADTSVGTVNATLTLTKGCLINGSASATGVNFGTLDFGSHPAVFDVITSSLSSAFGVQCTTGVPYTVTVVNSTSTAPSTVVGTVGNPARYLISSSDNTQGVAYSLYGESSMTNAIANGGVLTKTSTTGQIDYYNLYGKIQGGGNSVAVKPGTYTDVINLSVNY